MQEIFVRLGGLMVASPWAALLVFSVWIWIAVWLLGHLVYVALARAGAPFPFMLRLLHHAFASSRLLVFLLLLQFTLRSFPAPDVPLLVLRDLNSLLLVAVLTWLLVKITTAARDAILAQNPVSSADNLAARRIQTQTRVLSRLAIALIVLVGSGLSLMTFPALRQVGTSLLASAGLAGVAIGLAAKPIVSNLLAGMQIALAQPIRLDDVVIVQNEWGRIEEITGTYVVVRLWDQRSMIVPLQWFIEHPFQNWTRHSAELLGSVVLWLDYRAPVPMIRDEAIRLCESAPEWDGRLVEVQVVDTSPQAIQVRVLVSAQNADLAWHLRCRIREGLIAWLDTHCPGCLPALRLRPHEAMPGAGPASSG